ncbi:hypothetical protein, partial [Streptomyces viridiviolaceus]
GFEEGRCGLDAFEPDDPHAVDCTGKPRSKAFTAGGSDSVINRSVWFSCEGPGTYKVTLTGGSFQRKNLPSQKAPIKETSVSASAC